MEARAIRACALLLANTAIVQPAYAQRPSPPAQVVLIARMPDTFSVRLPEAASEARAHEIDSLATLLAFQTVEHLIPGTTITSACLITKPGVGREILANAGSLSTGREDAADSICNGGFHYNLREQIDHLDQKVSAIKNRAPLFHETRLDIFFSAL